MIDDNIIVITELALPGYIGLPDALAYYIEQQGVVVDSPLYNEELTADKQAIIGRTLFYYINAAHGMSEIPEATTYISVVGKGSARNFTQSKSDKGTGAVEIVASAPYPEQAMEIAHALYALFRKQPGFTAVLDDGDNSKQRGLLVKKAFPTGMEPEFRQKTDELWTFGFEVQAFYVKLDV